MAKLNSISTLRLDNVTCVKVIPSTVEVVICIFFGPKNIVVILHVFSIIGGDLIATFTMKQKMRFIHVCNNSFNQFQIGDD